MKIPGLLAELLRKSPITREAPTRWRPSTPRLTVGPMVDHQISRHALAIASSRECTESIFTAQCSCGWRGSNNVPFTGAGGKLNKHVRETQHGLEPAYSVN